MITDEERIMIKKILGVHYTNVVYDFLIKEKIVTNKNKPYSKRMIRAVCQQTRENKQIENAIIKLCHQETLKQKEETANRKNLAQKLNY